MPDGWVYRPRRCGLAGSPLLADDVDRRGQGAGPARHGAVEVGEDGSRPRLGRQPGRLAMDAVRVFPVRALPSTIRLRPIRLNAGALIFWLAAGAYLLVAGFTVLALNIVPGDSLSRVGIAERVLFSRDPHLEAIGFVWNPMQSLPLLPLIPLKFLWPDIVRLGFAAAIVSALFMAGAVYQIHATLRDFGAGRLPRLVLTVLFAVHPMILYYAVNGMSEAMLLFFLLIATRQLAGWLSGGHPPQLAYAGLALGGAYLSRYEAIGPAVAAIVVVLAASFIRSRGQHKDRLAAPMGHPFEPFTSVYGNASQVHLAQHQGVAAALESTQGWLPAASMALRRALILEPFALILIVVAVVVAFGKREARVVAPLAVFGAVVAFMLALYLRGALFGELRYFIAVIPAATLLIGTLLPDRRPSRPTSVSPDMTRPRRRVVAVGTTIVLVGLAASALPVAAI
ncbi:MAG: glycosyltransferase family 39 protein, partial [Chloroflexi bacterium]